MEKKKSKAGGLKLFFAKHYAKFLNKPQYIGITGAYSKSVTALVCLKVLAQKYLTQSFDQDIKDISDLAAVTLKIPTKSQRVILDLNINNETDVDSYSKLMRLSTLIITSLSPISSEAEKINQTAFQLVKLIEKLTENDSLIVNWDDQNLRKLIETKPLKPIFYGLDEKNCHVWASNLRVKNFQIIFELNYGVERVEIVSKLLGKHQIYPFLAAAALGIDQGITLGSIKKAIEQIEPIEHHFEPLLGHNDSVVIDDTYHDLEVAGLEALDTINLLPARRRVVVLGDTINYQHPNPEGLKEMARKIYKDRVDLVFLGGGSTQIIADELSSLGFIPERLETGLQNTQITAQLLKILSKGDVVLIKGSRSSKLSEVVKKISKAK